MKVKQRQTRLQVDRTLHSASDAKRELDQGNCAFLFFGAVKMQKYVAIYLLEARLCKNYADKKTKISF